METIYPKRTMINLPTRKTKSGFGNCCIFLFMCIIFLGLTLIENENRHVFTNNFDYSICNEHENTFQLKELVLEPSVPIKGENMNIQIKGDLSRDIMFGTTVIVSVKLNVVRLMKKTIDLCKELDGKINCPIVKGNQFYNETFKIPSEVPNGKYTVDILMLNSDNSKIFCGVVYVVFE
jgi:hypothetical protein